MIYGPLSSFDRLLKIESGTHEAVASPFSKYLTFDEIQTFLGEQLKSNGDLITDQVIGQSLERRPLRVLKFSQPGSNNSKPVLWVDSGIHAREWISTSTGIYLINQLSTGYRENKSEVMEILNRFDVHILPVVNPDGYDHTHTKVRNRSGRISMHRS